MESCLLFWGSSYLEEFRDENIGIIDGPQIKQCKGFKGGSHPFLESEGVYTCAICNQTVCQFCNIHESKELPEGED